VALVRRFSWVAGIAGSRMRGAWAQGPWRRRSPRLPTLKSTVGAVLAYVAAGPLPGEAPVLAPLTALLVIQSTLYETLTSGVQRVGSVVAGVLVAVGLSTVFGLTWWSLGLVVLAALLIGQRLRLGSQLMEVPISAMLVLAVGVHPEAAALSRVYETLVGAAVGVGVKMLTPPLYVHSAGDAVGELADQIGRLVREIGDELRQGWTHERAEHWLIRARDLPGPVQNAREALAVAEDSLRLNPRRHRAAHVPERLRSGLTALEFAAVHVRVICRSLSDRVAGLPPEELPTVPVRWSLARVFDAAGDVLTEFGKLVASDVTGPPRDRGGLRDALGRAQVDWEAASKMLLVDARSEPGIWQVHGALLAHIDRLFDDLDPDTGRAAAAVGRQTEPRRSRLPQLQRFGDRAGAGDEPP
jgi:hypothetical protein